MAPASIDGSRARRVVEAEGGRAGEAAARGETAARLVTGETATGVRGGRLESSLVFTQLLYPQ